MKQYIESITDELTDLPVASAEVWIYDDDNNLATLYAADGTTEVGNPLTTNEDGEFSFYSPTTELTALVYYGKRLRRRLRLLIGGGYSIAAQSAAQAALAASGIGEYPNTALGLAGTALTETFWVDLGTGIGQVYRHDAGPVATALQSFIIDPAAPASADVFAGGVPTTADLASASGAAQVGIGQTDLSKITSKTPQASGAVANGVTNDYASLIAARDACWAANRTTLAIPDGTYAFGTKLELSKDHWACIPAGEKAVLKHTGSGVAVSLSGPSDDATYGTYRGTLGGEKPLVIEGNSNTTRLLELDNYHHGNVNVDLKNGQVGVYINDSIGNSSSAGAVLTKFRVRVSQGNDGAFTTVPATGFYASEIYACECHLIIEHCGGGGNFGVYLNSSAANVFYGTSEGNVSGGVLIASNSYRNTFLGFFCEDNGTGFDWDIRGDYNRLVNCTGVSTSGSEISGDYCVVEGGKLKNLTITSGAAYTVLDGVALEGTFTDSSTTTTVRNCTLDGTPIADYAPRAGGALTLGTNISNYALTDSTYQAPAYFRLPNGLGEALGTFAATGAISIGDTIATIPSGYRPAKRITFTGYNISTNAVMGITIDSSGNVVTRTAIANGNVFGFGSPQFPRA